jgi:hypothetical protein
MPPNTISTVEYAATLRKKYEGLEVPVYKLREWFSTEKKVFFDCRDSDKSSCLNKVLTKPNFPAFRIYLVVKDFGDHGFMDVNFRNLGRKESLEHFINRYHQQLETMTKLSLQGAGREYVDCVGHGYEENML